MRYLVALTVACVLIAAGLIFAWQAQASMQRRFDQFKEELRAQKAAGKLPPEWEGVDLDHVELKMKVTSVEITRLNISRWLSKYWYVFVLFVLAICLGLAAVAGKMIGSHEAMGRCSDATGCAPGADSGG